MLDNWVDLIGVLGQIFSSVKSKQWVFNYKISCVRKAEIFDKIIDYMEFDNRIFYKNTT